MQALKQNNWGCEATNHNLHRQKVGRGAVLPPDQAMEVASHVPIGGQHAQITAPTSASDGFGLITCGLHDAGPHGDPILAFAMEFLWEVLCRFYDKRPSRARHVDVDQNDVVEIRHQYSKEFWRMAQTPKGHSPQRRGQVQTFFGVHCIHSWSLNPPRCG